MTGDKLWNVARQYLRPERQWIVGAGPLKQMLNGQVEPGDPLLATVVAGRPIHRIELPIQ